MYTGPDIVRTAAPRRTGLLALPTVLAVCCLGFLLFLIAATIVLALIPLYLPQRAVASNPNAFRTQPIQMMVAAQGNQAGRRRQAEDDLTDYIGGTVGDSGLSQVGSLFQSGLSQTDVQNTSISSISFVYAGSGKRKRRHSLLKRQVAVENTVYMLIVMTLTYSQNCPVGCQTNGLGALRESLYNLPVFNNFLFNNVPIFKGGRFFRNAPVLRLPRQRCRYISPIVTGSGAGSGNAAAETAPPTALQTSTLPATTPVIAG